jgi:ribonuclease HI
MHFDGAFNLPNAGAGVVLTSPSGDKLFDAVQLCFKPEHKVSNNIAEYEGLLAGLRAAHALGIKRLIVKGDSQLVVNFLNKSYTPKDEHIVAYLEELQKMEKRFQGLELKHIPRGENVEVDEIAKCASHRLAQPAGVFEERLFKPSASPTLAGPSAYLATATRSGGSGLWSSFGRPCPLGIGAAGGSGLDTRAQGLPR